MNYNGKNVVVTGHTGFIGSALVKALKKAGANVTIFEGDIRDLDDVSYGLDHTYDYFFHFAAPSSQILFKRDPRYCIDTTINGFLNVSKVCKEHGIKLIYPSTGLLSQGKTNEYASCKKMCEDIALSEGLDALGLRIFATYGPGEDHKRDYASVPFLFARDILADKHIEVWGDGEQTRDFIYIDDVIKAILTVAEEANEKVIDIGSGIGTSFNEVLDLIHSISRKKIDVSYLPKPFNYVEETLAQTMMLNKYYQPQTSMTEGVRRLVNHLKRQI